MSEMHLHTAHPDVTKRLKRAHGHLQNVISMIEEERSCIDIAQQLHAVERAISAAKKLVIHDHLDHCLEDVAEVAPAAVRSSIAEFKDITKYL
ncbi:MAG: metal-sensing transcriptional repressor [Polaromonas sp.]|jgi:DNA-binding FrmR family transcriptional regulator|uniref:metal-sensing transcriptional repressor n=1 Tax=unclassified Polaromonas TaxID=2638319 RepID=UPI000BCE0303|nr:MULTISPECIES: metal-sensing transcriptional repressor [unclassified Polaromonas]MDP2451799.1 metal-sensing transcriptional repressor [Polaromonas sp.]MDP3249670.1 metal-sensing transcriptional repressor [Polaromonas sp.]MDP3756344.1 metal-sensing transcriptional repressor [Polaromonas sp.]OYZ75279.1 MAG: metal resistance protein [Polaromonas sp. 24-63-21]OZA45043.1 MAG: metal resistance protein [Polaromonas sp. 17-63-33]